MNKLLIEEKDIIEASIVSGNLDMTRFRSEVFDAQRRFIKKDLGEDLYIKFLELFPHNLPSEPLYNYIYREYIFWMLLYKGMELYIEVGGLNIANNGITRSHSENNISLTSIEIAELATRYARRYEETRNDFFKYMNDNKDKYTEWKDTTSKINNFGGILLKNNFKK